MRGIFAWALALALGSATLTPAASRSILSPSEEPAWKFYQRSADPSTGELVLRRPAGTLLLNMLIKNEEDHLARTLPLWAKLPIDAWIIGVDDNNTDSSVEVIRRELGHIPGEIVTVHFDGMGPTWSKLVEAGWRLFPNITHGILADADFAPTQETLRRGFDKMELDVRCSKHIYTIVSGDQSRSNARKLDWIYRNMPGVSVKRRTHQSLHAPPIPGQSDHKGHPDTFRLPADIDITDSIMASKLVAESDMYITEVPSLLIDEAPGGYQDRTGGARAKAKRYIGFLEGDLEEFGADDSRSLYYLGIAHFDAFAAALREGNNQWGKLTSEDWEMLKTGVDYMKRRVALPASDDVGKKEERWFALLKLGEVQERYYGDHGAALSQYLEAALSDPLRSDAWFYSGQSLRLKQSSSSPAQQQPSSSSNANTAATTALITSMALLYHASSLSMPDRALFQWRLMYPCLPALELARTMDALLNVHRPKFITDAPAEDASDLRTLRASKTYKAEGRRVKALIADAVFSVRPKVWGHPAAKGYAEKLMKQLESIPLYLHWFDIVLDGAAAAKRTCAAEGEGAMAEEAAKLMQSIESGFESVIRQRASRVTGSSTTLPAAATATPKPASSPSSSSPKAADEEQQEPSGRGGSPWRTPNASYKELKPLLLVELPTEAALTPIDATSVVFWEEAPQR